MRVVAAVLACAALLLAGSQFAAYRGIGVDVPAYEGFESVAPAPEVDRDRTGSAHAYALLPVAALALVAIALTARGRWRLGRAISLLGVIGIAVSLLVDAPKGLDEGPAGRDFAGAEARLSSGFYAQLASSAVLVVGGLLLAAEVRRAQPATGIGRRERRAGEDPSQVAGARA